MRDIVEEEQGQEFAVTFHPCIVPPLDECELEPHLQIISN